MIVEARHRCQRGPEGKRRHPDWLRIRGIDFVEELLWTYNTGSTGSHLAGLPKEMIMKGNKLAGNRSKQWF